MSNKKAPPEDAVMIETSDGVFWYNYDDVKKMDAWYKERTKLWWDLFCSRPKNKLL